MEIAKLVMEANLPIAKVATIGLIYQRQDNVFVYLNTILMRKHYNVNNVILYVHHVIQVVFVYPALMK